MLEDDQLEPTIRAFFMEGEVPTTTSIQMKPLDSNKSSLPEFDFKSNQTFEEFKKARMEEELGVIENPTQEQLEQIIHSRKINRKPKEKTVYFKDFVDEIVEGPVDIIEAEIVNEPIRVKVKNKEL